MIRRFLPGLMVVLLSGCSSVSYYSQLASGQWQLLRARKPVAEVIADPSRPPLLREHLVQSQKARAFASEHLHVPDNQSYRLYADIGRPYVVWNVFATQEFSLSAENHCFPIAGCVAYRGYYSQGAARGEAALLRQRGMDVFRGSQDYLKVDRPRWHLRRRSNRSRWSRLRRGVDRQSLPLGSAGARWTRKLDPADR